MTDKQFKSLMYKAGFGKPHGEIDYEALSVVVATGLITDARLLLEKGKFRESLYFEHRAQRIEDKLNELGAFDFLNN